jgi:hypothetical protein
MGRLSLAARRARLLALRTTLDAGGGGALQLCTGVMPDEPETAPAAAPLAIIALDEVSFALDPVAATMALVPAVGFAAASGVPTWARYVDGAGNGVYLCTAGAPGSGAEMIVTNGATPPTAQLWTGGEITVTHTVSEP